MAHLLNRIRDSIVRWSLVFWACVLADWAGAVLGGILWYGSMLIRAPLWALPFIPDCPLAGFLASIALFGVRAKRTWPLLYAFVAFACMKYGAWTVAFWLKHWSGAHTVGAIDTLLFVTHIGLFMQGLLFVPLCVRLSFLKRFVVIAWFVLSIYVDYGLGYDPGMTRYVPIAFAFWVATVMTTVLGLGLFALPYDASDEP